MTFTVEEALAFVTIMVFIAAIAFVVDDVRGLR
jgi:hypothetical protein